MQSVVFAWLVTLLLREPAERVGLAQMSILLPGMLFILLAGAIADRVGLRRQALWAQLFAALTPFLLIYFPVRGRSHLRCGHRLCAAHGAGSSLRYASAGRAAELWWQVTTCSAW
jgi:MFS family permease